MLENLDMIGLVGGGTLGSIATMVVQKMMNKSIDKTDITARSVDILSGMQETLNSAIKQLQDQACYDDKCEDRINGKQDCTDCNKFPITRKRRSHQ